MCGHEHDLQYIRKPSDTVSYIVSGGGSDVRYGEQVRGLAGGCVALWTLYKLWTMWQGRPGMLTVLSRQLAGERFVTWCRLQSMVVSCPSLTQNILGTLHPTHLQRSIVLAPAPYTSG